MNIGTWNVQGLSPKLHEVISEVNQANADIVVLTETKKKSQGSENLGKYDHFYSGVAKEKRAQQGVSILIRKTLRKCITSWEAINERIIKMNLNIKNHKITILGVYAENNEALVNKKDEFFEKLSREISKIGTAREVIVAGDMNARTGKKINNKTVGQFGEDTINDNGYRLIALSEHNQLKILNGFFEHPLIHKYTWTQHTKKLRSIIDYILIRQKTKLIAEDVRAYRGPTCGSDHYLIKAKIIFPWKGVKPTNKHDDEKPEEADIIKYNISSLDHQSVKELYQKRLDEKLPQVPFNTPEEHYQCLKKCIHEAAYEALGEWKAKEKVLPYWWDDEIEGEIELKRKAYKQYLSSKTHPDKISYKEAQAKVRKMIIQKKNKSWEMNCSRINTYLGGRKSSESWKLLKSLRQDTKKELISPINLKDWDKYFNQLLTENRKEFLDQQKQSSSIQLIASPIRIKPAEVKNICLGLKNGKSAGPGNIPPELIKYGTQKLFEHLTQIFQKCINGMKTPEEWKTSYMTTIHKKGRKDQCDNYRGIAVSNTLARIYGKILTRKIEDEYRDLEAEEQAGFRAGRSTADHLFSVTQILEKKTAFNQEIHMLFVDLKKAYDNIPQNKLWEALQNTNINVNLIRAVKQTYEQNTTKVKLGKKLSKGCQVNKGLKQGCCLSPLLFKIYLEQALKTWKRKCKNMGIPLTDDSTLYTLCFADDQIVLAQDYEDLQYMSKKLIEEYKHWGLEVNLSKTEYMCVGGTQQDLILEEQHQIIKHCNKYKYLGMTITQDGTTEQAIQERNTQGRRAISLLNNILWDQNISKNNKQNIYNSIVKSVITYSSEVWQLKQKSEKMLEATEMDFWRRSAGKSRMEKITNERIREIMGVKHSVVEDIKVNQLKWYGHVQRMTNDRLPKQILNWTPTGRRKRGRPRKSWREGIDREIEDRQLDENLWQDRQQWRLEIGRRRKTL